MAIGIVGGGIAGLYAGLLLREQGHEVTVLEANTRLGGRIYSHHFTPTGPGDDPFFEAGAMRLPLSSFHACVFDLVRYLNKHNEAYHQIEFLPYVLEHANNRIYLQGQMRKCGDTTLAAEMGLPQQYHGKSARQILLEVMTPWINLLRDDFERGFQEVLRYDDITFRQYLHRVALLPHSVIDYIELIMSQTNQYDQSFTDLMMQTLHFNTPDWVTVKGGLSRIIDAAANVLGPSSIFRNAPVTDIHELADGRVQLGIEGFPPQQRVFNKVILAIPPSAIQNIRVRPQWSFLKEQAIRSIHEGPLYKMGLHFRTRFWEQTAEPNFGGQSQTDLRLRWIVYPSNDLGSSQSGCLILYSGMTDALRWSWTPRDERVRLALEDLNNFFKHEGVNVYEQFIDAFDVNWPGKYTYANTMFLPGQFSRYFEVMRQPEGNIFFAGEHISRHHTWVAGAVESAHDTIKQVLADESLQVLGAEKIHGTAPVKHGRGIAHGLVIDKGAESVLTLEAKQGLGGKVNRERDSQLKITEILPSL